MSIHTEWLSLVETSGPFLAVPVLDKILPQGLENIETPRKRRLREAYEEWREANDTDDPLLSALHNQWVSMVFEELLEFGDNDLVFPTNGDRQAFSYSPQDNAGVFKSDCHLNADDNQPPYLLISIQPPNKDLERIPKQDGWPANTLERMVALCRANGIDMGLVTNGERWTLVNAPIGTTSSHVSWYSRLWFQEPLTLKAFQSLLGVRRFWGPEDERLPALLNESLEYNEEVTDTLGEQVRRAVEVLVQSLDQADLDRNRELLKDVSPAELYEAGLTVMMRLVFLLCAEERDLLMLGDPLYDQHYAISTLRSQLEDEADRHGHEVLEMRHDAWSRILSVFRAVYGGISHETLRMPAMGGSLFDPDKFPFLEGRDPGTSWRESQAIPLPIDNRTVLLLLRALQILEQRGGALLLSYRALDVEQIGHVYEGLLEHTVKRMPDVTLGLQGTKSAKNPSLTLSKLEAAASKGEKILAEMFKDATQKSLPAIKNALEKDVDEIWFGKILAASGGEEDLAERIFPFANLIREDAWGDPIVYLKGAFAVTIGSDRRETGTHYTPKSLTESIVKATLEPIVYIGPEIGAPKEEWKLKSSAEILDLKVCDPAMGSGAFLVEACRYLSRKLVKTWEIAEANKCHITIDGHVMKQAEDFELLPSEADERLIIAHRLVAERCLYGVDMNPLAVELAKLSIWLITLSKGRPFGFLDHNLRSGNSLLGVHKLEQLTKFSLQPGKKEPVSLFAAHIEKAVRDALTLRKQLRGTTIRDIRDVNYMEQLDRQARNKIKFIECVADAMVGLALASRGSERSLEIAMSSLSAKVATYIEGNSEMGRKISVEAKKSLSIDFSKEMAPRKPFHWILTFPEVFEQGGFDGVVGNPPWGAKLENSDKKYWDARFLMVGDYETALAFFEQTTLLLQEKGALGFVLPNTFLLNDSAQKCREFVASQRTTRLILDLSNSDVFIGRSVRCCGVVLLNSKREEIESFWYAKQLTTNKQQCNEIGLGELKGRPHWSSLDKKAINISAITSTIDDWFDVKQGYIPYRKTTLIKRFGEEQGQEILKQRKWHSLEKETKHHVKELKGKDVSNWSVDWSGLWVKYGDWVSTYLDDTWFVGERVLVREIVAKPPRLIVAAQCNEHYVHNPSIIVIRPKYELNGLIPFLELYLNSALATKYIASISAKVSKGMFPKVLVKDVRALPFPPIYLLDESLLNEASVLRGKVVDDDSAWQEVEAFLEKVIRNNSFQKPINMDLISVPRKKFADKGSTKSQSLSRANGSMGLFKFIDRNSKSSK